MSTTAELSMGDSIKAIDEVSLEETSAPSTLAELGEVLRESASRGQAVYPVGGGTALGIGYPPSRPGMLLDLGKLSRIDDYPAEDMTITVEAGIRIAELARLLAKNGQMLPIDCADPEQATLGGALATAASGPRRFGYGTPRDYVIGIDVVDASGQRIHGGGRVVKNVAGYDFMKLHTGAHGSLGVIAQVTLKVRPLAESRGVITCGLHGDQIEPVLARLNRSKSRPVGIELLAGNAATDMAAQLGEADAEWRLVLLFEESGPANDWQIKHCQAELQNAGVRDLQIHGENRYAELLETLVHWQAHGDGCVMFKANVLPGKVAEYCQFARQQLPQVSLLAHAGNGIVWGALDGDDLEATIRGLNSLRKLAFVNAGNLTIPRCPVEWKSRLPIWGTPRGEWPWMAKLKGKLDPKDILNPGRMFR